MKATLLELPPADQPLRDRLPLAQRNEPVFALKAEDHYVLVRLKPGHHLVQMRWGMP